eukprot:1194716-Prorocentrum_minimum.AAC.2
MSRGGHAEVTRRSRGGHGRGAHVPEEHTRRDGRKNALLRVLALSRALLLVRHQLRCANAPPPSDQHESAHPTAEGYLLHALRHKYRRNIPSYGYGVWFWGVECTLAVIGTGGPPTKIAIRRYIPSAANQDSHTKVTVHGHVGRCGSPVNAVEACQS